MPDLVGTAQSSAEKTLASIDLYTVLEPASSGSTSSAECCTVAGQDPSAGSDVNAHSVVTLKVVGAPPAVNVPSVVGENENTAASSLRQLGYNPVSLPDLGPNNNGSGGAPYSVLWQEPQAGHSASPGSQILISILTPVSATP